MKSEHECVLMEVSSHYRSQIEAAFKDTTAEIIKLIDQQIRKADGRGKTVSVRR